MQSGGHDPEKGEKTPLISRSGSRGGSRTGSVVDDSSGHHHRRQEVLETASKKVHNSLLPNLLDFAKEGDHADDGKSVLSAQEVIDEGKVQPYVEHKMTVMEIAEHFKTDIDWNNPSRSMGLKSTQAEFLLKENGPNEMTPPPRTPLWLLFLVQFTNLFMVLLLAAAVMSIAIYLAYPDDGKTNLYVGIILIVVVVATCYETYAQEAKSDELMESFKKLVPEVTAVIRDGAQRPINANVLVVGDIIRLKAGDKVPADCRIIHNMSMKVDQAMITGESEAVESHVNNQHADALEARNLIFSGSLIVDGSCLATVIRTGDDTLMGTMVELTGDVGKGSSNLKKDIDLFVFYITVFSLVQAISVLIAAVLLGESVASAFVNGFIVIVVANVPQGLPSTVVACLVIIAERMGAQKVFVKKLDVIETLGSCTLICTDKTGTLTQNLMSAANLWVLDRNFTHEEFIAECDAERSERVPSSSQTQLISLLQVATLNSRVLLERKNEDDALAPTGDATELGLYRFFAQCLGARYNSDIEEYRSVNPKVHEIPFNSSNKWQMSIHAMEDRGGQQILLLKGAPDVLLSKCSTYLNENGDVVPIDEAFQDIYQAAYERYGGMGERVLGFAMKPLSKTYEEEEAADPKYKEQLKANMVGTGPAPITDLTFVGLITLIDPPRPEVPQAIKDCHTACVKVVMVTGDHPLTAAAIAKKIGLITLPQTDLLDNPSTKASLIEEYLPQLGSGSWDNDDDDAVTKIEIPFSLVIHGGKMDALTEDDWKLVVRMKEIVFARTSPEQKLTIVKKFTEAGNVTAMTGDGVNDAPALKQAAIGVAMGMNGSDVAREAADIVLLDDNFASIVVGIKEGRLLFANLKKSIAYTLAHSIPEVIPVLVYTLVGWPEPINAILLLLIDLLTELVPATSLAFEKPERNIMSMPPRDINRDKLVSLPLLAYSYLQAGVIITGCCFFVYFMTFGYYGITASDIDYNNNNYFVTDPVGDFTTASGSVYDTDEQTYILGVVQAGYYLMIVCAQACHVFVCRTATISIFEHGIFDNWITDLGVVIALGLGCIVVYTPFLQDIDEARNPMSLYLFYGTMMAFVGLWGWSEGRKLFSRNYPNHPLNHALQW